MSDRRYDRENAEFHQENDFDFTLLDKLIPNFDSNYKKDLQNRMIDDCESIQTRIKRLSITIPSKDRSDSNLIRFFTLLIRASYFKIKFSVPITNHVHPAFKLLREKIRNSYNVGVTEFLPYYMLDLNHISLSKIGTPGDSSVNSIGNGLYTQYSHEKSGKYAQFSSTNILLLGGSNENVLKGTEIIDRCFEYLYWNLPVPKNMKPLTINNLIYHSSNQIYKNNILELNKTIIKIIRIGRTESLTILKTQNVKCLYADVIMLVDDGDKIFSEKRRIFLIESVANLFKEGEIFTGLILSQNYSQPYYSIVIGTVGKKIESNDVTHLISIVMQKKLQYLEENSSITYVDKITNLSVDVSEMINNNPIGNDIFNSSIKSISNFENNVKKSIEALFPFYINNEGDVHQLSTTMVSFLLSYDLKTLSDKKAISTIIKLLDLLKINSTGWGDDARSQLKISSTKSNPLTSSIQNSLLENMPLLVNMMVYSRIFSQNF